MAQKKDNAKEPTWRDIYRSEPDGLRALIQQTVQEVLEAEMDEAVGAQKSSGRRSDWDIDRATTRGHW